MKKFINHPKLKEVLHQKELLLSYFFYFLFAILLLKLFWVQVVKGESYRDTLNRQHYKEASLTPKRGNIFALDKWGHPIQLTENITFYDLALDPQELATFTGGVPMKPRFIEIVSPVIYKHLCELNGMNDVSKEQCVKNVELFAGVELLPKMPEFFYYGSGIASPEYQSFNFTGHEERIQNLINSFTKEKALELIVNRLNNKIKTWIKTENYLGYFVDEPFLEEVKSLNLPYLLLEKGNYLYISPGQIKNKSNARATVRKLLQKWKYPIGNNFDRLFEFQEWRYIKLVHGLNPILAQEIRDLKKLHRNERSEKTKEREVRTPVLYGLILEPFTRRYYPYGEFLSNILWYVNKQGVPYYGIEQYHDNKLKGKKGEIKGRTSSWVGNMGANDFEIIHAQDGEDIYLSIDVGLQKEVENIAKEYVEEFRSDFISAMVIDTSNGEIKASVNYPSFNPNNYNDAYILKPLGEEYHYLIDDDTYVDIPVYIHTGGQYKLASFSERKDTELKKYIASNVVGPQVFVDKNISVPFEPGSTFKAFTVGIGVDNDEIKFTDHYDDEGVVKVGIQTIRNATTACMGYHSYLHALIHSCNVGMVKIIQKIGKYPFFNYLKKLGFWELTEVELAGEKEGFVDDVNIVSFARFLNNSFGQGITTTQIQLAAAYASLVNGGYYIKPTILNKSFKTPNEKNKQLLLQEKKQIFKTESSEQVKYALGEVIANSPSMMHIVKTPGYKLMGKSGTAQISFRGKYQRGEGWTNATFSGIVSEENPKYAVMIWIRRPRKSQWWGYAGGIVFQKIAQYIISYNM